jgi:molecular chaperone DnaK (HSP70)
VEVEFLVDANGILNVSAREQRSGVAAQIQVVPNYGLTKDEVARMMQESIAAAREDFAAHRRIDLRNQVMFDTQKCEQMLSRLGDEISPAEREKYERAIADLRRLAEEATDLDALHAALQEFGRSTVPLAEKGISMMMTSQLKEAQSR